MFEEFINTEKTEIPKTQSETIKEKSNLILQKEDSYDNKYNNYLVLETKDLTDIITAGKNYFIVICILALLSSIMSFFILETLFVKFNPELFANKIALHLMCFLTSATLEIGMLWTGLLGMAKAYNSAKLMTKIITIMLFAQLLLKQCSDLILVMNNPSKGVTSIDFLLALSYIGFIFLFVSMFVIRIPDYIDEGLKKIKECYFHNYEVVRSNG